MPKLTHWLREYRVAAAVSMAGTILSLYLHLCNSWSPLVMKAADWTVKLDAHLTWYPFKIRLLQTYTAIGVSELLGISTKWAFYGTQYVLAFILALLFFRYLRKLEFSVPWANFGVSLLVLSLPILAAHFEPIHTWDDIWVYIFLVLSFGAIVERHWLAAGVFFTLGCFAREQTLFFYPLLLLGAWQDRRLINRRTLVISLLMPIVVFGIYFAAMWENPVAARWSCYEYNFSTPARTADSVVSLINSFGFLWVVAAFGLVRRASHFRDRAANVVFWGALYAVPLTTVFATLFTLVRETRILFPPFLFVFPLALWELQPLAHAWRDRLSRRGKVLSVFLLVALAALGFAAAKWFWPALDFTGSVEVRRNYAGISLGLSAAFLVAWLYERRLRSHA